MSRVEIDEDGNTSTYHLIQPSTTQYVIDPAFKCEVVETPTEEYLDDTAEGEGEYATEYLHSEEHHLSDTEEGEEEYQIVFTGPGQASSSNVRKSPPKQYFCMICGNTYKSSGSLKLHTRACEKNHANDCGLKKRTCEECGKVLASPTYLKEHMSSKHYGKDVIKCNQCYRKFFDEDKYKKHLEAHEREFDLAGQFLSDTPMDDKKVVKQYTCSFCSKEFVVVFDSKQAKRRYACDECREKYSNEHELKKRKEEMMGNQEFICSKCNRKFVFEGFLQRHMTKCDGSIKRKREPKGIQSVHQ